MRCHPLHHQIRLKALFVMAALIVTQLGMYSEPRTPHVNIRFLTSGPNTTANLFLCGGAACSPNGNGAGTLTVDEVATVPGWTLDQNNDGREDGVGLVAFGVQFDHTVFDVSVVPDT
jgi:hypothetical protein